MNNGYELRQSSSKGEGVFATKTFEFGDTVMIGVIDDVSDGNHSHASQVGENEYVFHGGLITKVNHSCEPNCGIHVSETGAHDFVVLNDTINVNDEITFDYAMRNYNIDFFPKKCMCGSKTCRTLVTGWKDLSREKKLEYAGFVAPYLLALDALRRSVPSI